FRFRSADIKPEDLKKLETSHPTQFAFVSGKDVNICGFDDFTRVLKKELETLAYRLEHPECAPVTPPPISGPGAAVANGSSSEVAGGGVTENGGAPPLVRVAIRSRNPDEIWDRLALWMYEQENVRPEQIEATDSFIVKQGAIPCQGLMVVCDDSA